MDQDKLTLLQDLHRPLEEHWSVKSKFGLDAKGSDYIFKQHITRLEDIYVNQRPDPIVPPSLLHMSPVSQLYGINGIKTTQPGWEEKQKAKEEKWVDNFQKYNVLTESSKPPKREDAKDSNSRSRSPVNTGRPGQLNRMHHKYKAENHKDNNSKNVQHKNSTRTERKGSSRCFDSSISKEHLIMLGLYRLSPDQEHIFNSFVDMISEFDQFDMARIAEDALKKAQRDDLLASYGGTGDDSRR